MTPYSPCNDGRSVVLSDQATMLRGRMVTTVPPTWASKDPSVDVVRSVDFCQLVGERIIQTVDQRCAGVTILSGSVRGTLVSLSLRGGVDGVPARVELRALCTDGTGEAAAIILPIIAQITLPEGNVMPASQPVTTTDATPGLLYPPPLLAAIGSSVGIIGQVIARNTITDDTARWDVVATVKMVGTVNCAIVLPSVIPSPGADVAMLACNLQFASGPNPALVVTGFVGSVIIWEGEFHWASA